MDIEQISKEINKNAHEKGFWEKFDLCQKLLLIVSEITEAMEADRKDKYVHPIDIVLTHDEILALNDGAFIKYFEQNVKDTFEDEMADASIRIFDLCYESGTDLPFHIQAKHRYNTLRPHKHGKNY